MERERIDTSHVCLSVPLGLSICKELLGSRKSEDNLKKGLGRGRRHGEGQGKRVGKPG
jgi:hypothetical protein